MWFKSGVIPPAGTYDGYWADPYTLFLVEIIAMQFAELRRLQDFRFPGSMGKQYFLGLERVMGGSGDPAYPGACAGVRCLCACVNCCVVVLCCCVVLCCAALCCAVLCCAARG